MSNVDFSKTLAPKLATVQQRMDAEGVVNPSQASLLWRIDLKDYQDVADWLWENARNYGDEDIGGVHFAGDWICTNVELSRDGPDRERTATYAVQTIARANPDNPSAVPTEAAQSFLAAPDGHSESKGDTYTNVRTTSSMITGSIPTSTGYVAARRTVVKNGPLSNVSIEQDKIYTYLTGGAIAEPEIYRFKEGTAQVNTWRNISASTIDAHVTAAQKACFGDDEAWNSDLTPDANGVIQASDGTYWFVSEVSKVETGVGSYDLAVSLQYAGTSSLEAIVVSWQYTTYYKPNFKSSSDDETKRYLATDTYIKGTKVEFFYANAQNAMVSPTAQNVGDELIHTDMSKVITHKGTELYMVTAHWLNAAATTYTEL